MEIYGLPVTGNFFEQIDDFSCHIELGNAIRCVHLSDTEFETVNELQTAIEALIF